MLRCFSKAVALGLIFGLFLVACAKPTATPVPKPTPTLEVAGAPTPTALLKAKQEAEAKGFIFETSHDDILAKAKAEGKVNVLSSLDPSVYPYMAPLVKKMHPYLDVYIEEITGTEASQRFLLELKTGTPVKWDVVHASEDFYVEFLQNAKKFDVLGMAQNGVLAINPKMVDANYRTITSVATGLSAIAYNKKLISEDKVPKTWEGFLAPELKGRKILVDIRPHGMVAMMTHFGEQWVVDYAKKLAAQEPIWVRGHTRALTSMVAGEYALFQQTNWHSCLRAQEQDPTKSLVCKLIEPVPVRLMEHEFVPKPAPHPYAGLLYIEVETSPEGQKVIDDYEPFKSSLYGQGKIAEAVKGFTKLSINAHETYSLTPHRMELVVEAYGFPKAEVK